MTMPNSGGSTKQFEMDGLSLIAWNLRLLRTERGYTQDRLALEAGVDRKFVGWLEARKGNPTLRMLERLAETLSVPLQLFFAPPPLGSAPPQPLKCGRKRSDQLAMNEAESLAPSAQIGGAFSSIKQLPQVD